MCVYVHGVYVYICACVCVNVCGVYLVSMCATCKKACHHCTAADLTNHWLPQLLLHLLGGVAGGQLI